MMAGRSFPVAKVRQLINSESRRSVRYPPYLTSAGINLTEHSAN